MTCRNDAVVAGGSYPRSCPTCGHGPCKNTTNKEKHLEYKDQKMIIKHAPSMSDLQAEEKRLQDELVKIQKARKEREAEERYERNKKILDNKHLLLPLIEHTRTSCSDKDIANGFHSATYGPRCVRCALLELGEHNLDVYNIHLTLEFTHPC